MSRIARKTAVPLSEVLEEFIRVNGLSEGLKRQSIYSAWDDVSGAAPYTIRKFYRDGKLYVTLNSSVVRSQLLFQKSTLISKLNSLTEPNAIKDLILK